MKYPNIEVQLSGKDGNAFAVLAEVLHAMKKANIPQSEQDAFVAEATSGDYNHLLATCTEYVNVK